MLTLGIGLSISFVSVLEAGEVLPLNLVTLNGNPVTLNGFYVVLNP